MSGCSRKMRNARSLRVFEVCGIGFRADHFQPERFAKPMALGECSQQGVEVFVTLSCSHVEKGVQSGLCRTRWWSEIRARKNHPDSVFCPWIEMNEIIRRVLGDAHNLIGHAEHPDFRGNAVRILLLPLRKTFMDAVMDGYEEGFGDDPRIGHRNPVVVARMVKVGCAAIPDVL